MDIALALNALTTFAVVGGVIFAAWQVRVASKTRTTEVTLQVLQVLHNLQLTDGILALLDAPDGLSATDLRSSLGDRWNRAFHAIIMLDGLGLLVYRGEVDTELADDFFKHSIWIVWEKFKVAGLEMRKQQGNTAFEWLQWLAEAQRERGVLDRVPAYLQRVAK